MLQKLLVLSSAIGVLALGCVPVPENATNQVTTGPSQCRVVDIVDGDTVDLSCPGQPRERARLMGYDTPETYEPGCRQELALGRQATQAMRQLVRQGQDFDFVFEGRDRYSRLLVWMTIDGENVADTMVQQGLAVRYSGGRRINWCDRLNA